MTLDQLKRARLAKKRPDDYVLVSTIGRITGVQWPVIIAQQNADWSPLYGLDVLIAHAGKNLDAVVELASKIAGHYPRELECWNVLTEQMVSVVANYHHHIRETPPI